MGASRDEGGGNGSVPSDLPRRVVDVSELGAELDLTYPCAWSYTIIGEDETVLRDAVREVVAERSHELSFSRRSRGGKYLSFQLELVVRSDRERLTIFQRLHAHAAIRYVL